MAGMKGKVVSEQRWRGKGDGGPLECSVTGERPRASRANRSRRPCGPVICSSEQSGAVKRGDKRDRAFHRRTYGETREARPPGPHPPHGLSNQDTLLHSTARGTPSGLPLRKAQGRANMVLDRAGSLASCVRYGMA
ncbi:hypothetical protein AAFF_G00206540 [Aldrovandia affinis]|uniref:Uncharacterized protein n=1 Tax=Aldrovandia affinis TaxID=143900 RepID=A0AAD7W5B2_9TELE|nr:hypothetical protein AAFF_G00206540 [Aldrovandia affinis]